MASQGGGGGTSATDILKLLYGTAMGSAAATTDGIGLTLSDATRNTEVT